MNCFLFFGIAYCAFLLFFSSFFPLRFHWGFSFHLIWQWQQKEEKMTLNKTSLNFHDIMKRGKGNLKKAFKRTCVLEESQLKLRLSFVSVVLDFNASLNDVVPLSPISSPVDLMKMEKKVDCWWVSLLCCFCSPFKLSWVSVVFAFIASLNDVAPSSPIPFPFQWHLQKNALKKWLYSFVLFESNHSDRVE